MNELMSYSIIINIFLIIGILTRQSIFNMKNNIKLRNVNMILLSMCLLVSLFFTIGFVFSYMSYLPLFVTYTHGITTLFVTMMSNVAISISIFYIFLIVLSFNRLKDFKIYIKALLLFVWISFAIYMLYVSFMILYSHRILPTL